MIHEPSPGYALVKLSTSQYGSIPVPQKSHDSITYGEIVAVNSANKEAAHLVGRIGHWDVYKDGIRLPDNFAFVRLDDIAGTTLGEAK